MYKCMKVLDAWSNYGPHPKNIIDKYKNYNPHCHWWLDKCWIFKKKISISRNAYFWLSYWSNIIKGLCLHRLGAILIALYGNMGWYAKCYKFSAKTYKNYLYTNYNIKPLHVQTQMTSLL
jgi:hypothetical protein